MFIWMTGQAYAYVRILKGSAGSNDAAIYPLHDGQMVTFHSLIAVIGCGDKN